MEETGIDSLCHQCAPDLVKAKLAARDVKTAALSRLPQLHQFSDRLIGRLLESAH
jgi:hypothetical protein